jgi:outer membrane cobalamin receptor
LVGPKVKKDCTVKKTTFSALKSGAAPMVLGLAIISGPALAQEAPAASDEPVIVVTGTRIVAPNQTSVAPITTVSNED